MKKLLAFVFSLGLLVSTELSSMVTKVEPVEGVCFFIEKTYTSGKVRTFQRIDENEWGENEWYELDSSGSIEQVNNEQSRRLETSFQTYLLGQAVRPIESQAQKSQQQPARVVQPEQHQQVEQPAPQPGSVQVVQPTQVQQGALQAPQPFLVQYPDAVNSAGGSEHKRPRESETFLEGGVAHGLQLSAIPAKRSEPIDYAKIVGLLRSQDRQKRLAVTSVQAAQQETQQQQSASVVGQQTDIDWESRKQALEDYMRKNKCKKNCLVM